MSPAVLRFVAVAGTTICRILLGKQLAQLRTGARVRREQAASHIHRSLTHMVYIEGGRNPPTDLDELRRLADLYHATRDELAAMELLWADAKKETWFSGLGLPESLARYVGLETDAETVRSWQLENIPGLLQTEQYMRALYQLEPYSRSPRATNKRIIARLQRQQRLVDDNPLTLIAVISQSALERCARAGAVGHRQLSQLRERAAWPNVELRVLPWDLGLHSGQDSGFSLLSFPDQLLPDMVYEESVTGDRLTDAPSAVAQCHILFDELRGRALTADKSTAMIVKLLEP